MENSGWLSTENDSGWRQIENVSGGPLAADGEIQWLASSEERWRPSKENDSG